MSRPALLLALFATAVSISAAPAQAATSPWQVVSSPNVGTHGENNLNSVAAVSTTDAWAVGTDPTGGLVEHWNGTKWALVQTPAAAGTWLINVSAPSASNVTILGIVHGGQMAILHYNGSSWSRTTPPTPLNAGSGFSAPIAMASLSATDIWVGLDGGFVDHWNGHGWKGIRTAPAELCPMAGYWIGAIHPISDTNVWFSTGLQCNLANPITNSTSLDQWNGSKVIRHGAPSAPEGQGNSDKRIQGMAATGSDIWTVGYWSSGDTGALGGYWNGSKWTSPSPNFYSTTHEFTAVAAASPTSVWAVGLRIGADNHQDNLLEYWNGTSWTEWGGPNPDMYTNTLNAVAVVPHSNQFWAVGSSGYDTTEKTMILRVG